MTRITRKDLDPIVARINWLTGMAPEPYTRGADGRYLPNPGTYHLEEAYGGVRLLRMAAEGTGTHDVTGRMTYREAYHALHAYRDGVLAGIAAAEWRAPGEAV